MEASQLPRARDVSRTRKRVSAPLKSRDMPLKSHTTRRTRNVFLATMSSTQIAQWMAKGWVLHLQPDAVCVIMKYLDRS